MEVNRLHYSREETILSSGIDNIPLLKKILCLKEPTLIQLITKNLFQKQDLNKYEIMMGCLLDAEHSNNFEYFYPFFDCTPSIDDKEFFNKETILNFDQHLKDPKFKKYIKYKRHVARYVNMAADFNHDPIYEQIYEE